MSLLVAVVVGVTVVKKSRLDEIWHQLTQSESRISDMTSYFQDGGHDVISCRKVPPSGE